MHRREKKAERKSKNSAVSRKGRKGKFLQVSLLKKCKVGVRRDSLNVQMQVFLPLFMRFLLMISGSRKVTVKRENMETEHK